MDKIGLFFKCQSCSDYVLTSNIQCNSGHQVCERCYEDLTYCITCHQKIGPSTRIPFILTADLDPILNVGDSFDLLLPSLLRVAPALHPCSQDEMIFSGDQPNNFMSAIGSASSENNTKMIATSTTNNLPKKTSLADQILLASNSEVEETLSKLMMLASMSQGPNNQNSTSETTAPPPGLAGLTLSNPLPTPNQSINFSSNQPRIDSFGDF